MVSWSLHSGQLWFSVMVSTCSKKKPPDEGTEMHLPVGGKDEYFEWSWELHWFSEVAVIGSPLEPLNSLAGWVYTVKHTFLPLVQTAVA